MVQVDLEFEAVAHRHADSPRSCIIILFSIPSHLDLKLQLLYPDNGHRTGMFAQALDAFRFSSTDKQRLLEMATKAVGNEAKMTPDLVNWMRAEISEDLRDKPRLASSNTNCNCANP